MNATKFLKFDNGQKGYIFSGYTGLIMENDEEIENIIKNGTDDIEVNKLIFGSVKHNEGNINYINSENKLFKSLVVFVTNYCNLACEYCYNRVNKVDDSVSMDLEVFKKSMEFLLNNFKYEKSIHITYFGGEPLSRFEFIKDTVNYLKSIESEYNINFTFGMTTNGTIFNDEIQKFILENKIGLTISVDGDKETHNNSRKYLNGSGSYDNVMKTISELSKHRRIGVRPTIIDVDTDLVKLYEELTSKGVYEMNLDIASGEGYLENAEEKKIILSKRIKELADYFISNLQNKKVVRVSNFFRFLKSIHFGQRRKFPCSAGYSAYSLSADGSLYFCHRFNNISEYKWGNIFEDFDDNKRISFLNKHHVEQRNNKECDDCWGSIFCGGDCYHSTYMEHKCTEKVSDLHCFFVKEIIKNSIYIYSLMTEEEKQILDDERSRQGA